MNCVDCLDRTNNCMGCFGSVILLRQLELFGFNTENLREEEGVKNELLALLFEMYGINGDFIAKQYAGSEAFHKATLIEAENGNWKTQKQNYAFLALKRYISNTLMDNEKQKSISLFLGDFLPNFVEKKQLWDLDIKEFNDHMLLDIKNPFSNYQEKMNWWLGKPAFSYKEDSSFSNRMNVEILDRVIKENEAARIHLRLNNNSNNNNSTSELKISHDFIENFEKKPLDYQSLKKQHSEDSRTNFIDEAFQSLNQTYKSFLALEKNVIFHKLLKKFALDRYSNQS